VPKKTLAPTSTSGNSHASTYRRERITTVIDSSESSSTLIQTTASTPWATPTGGATVSTDFQLVTGALSSSSREPGVGTSPQIARVGAANIEPNRK
jgi:hypothetical protein